MRRRCSSPLHFILCTSVLTVLLCSYASPVETQEQWVARAVEAQWQPVKLDDTFRPGDTIRVLERSRADVTLLDQSVVRLNVNTTMTFKAVQEERTSVVDL